MRSILFRASAYVLLSTFCLNATAALFPEGKLAETKSAFQRIALEQAGSKLKSEVNAGSIVKELQNIYKDPADKSFIKNYLKKNHISPRETVFAKNVKQIPNGWEFWVAGVKTSLTVEKSGQIVLNGKLLTHGLSAEKTDSEITNILSAPSAGMHLWNLILPEAYADARTAASLKLLTFFVVLIAGVVGIREFAQSVDPTTAERYFLNFTRLCERERAANARTHFNRSETKKVLDQLVKHDIIAPNYEIDIPDCDIFVRKVLVAYPKKDFKTGTLNFACMHAKNLGTCVKKFQETSKKVFGDESDSNAGKPTGESSAQ